MVLSVALLFAACVDKDDAVTSSSDRQKISIENSITTTEYTIPTQSGQFTIVYTADGMLVAIDSVPNTIMVPSGVELKTAYAPANEVNQVLNTLNINQATGESNNYFTGNSVYTLWQTIAFEDMLVGDNDYNDLVIHCKYQTNNAKQIRIGIEPVALGSSLRIGLGCDIYKGNTFIKEIMVTDNCRRDLFYGNVGYLNTQTFNFGNTETNGHLMSKVVKYAFTNDELNNSGAISVNWFINVYDVTGTTIQHRFNALSTHYIDNNMLDANKNPYGIISTHTGKRDADYGINTNVNSGHDWLNYPKEKEKIYEVYPSWNSWLRTTDVTFATMYAAGFNSDNTFHAGQLGLYIIRSGYGNLFADWATSYLVDGNVVGIDSQIYPAKK